MNAYYRLATMEDVDYVAANLRQADRDELLANGWTNPYKALEQGWALSEPCYVMIDRNDVPFGLCGAVPDPDEAWKASVWMMATDGLEREPLGVARGSRKLVKEWSEKFSLLWNHVDTRNEVHLAWLKWLGFKFINKIEHNNHSFYEFAKVTHHV